MTGEIFDIKHFAVHDGPGIRTTIFLKGCPLHCVWCHNPEGMRRGKDLWVKREACIHCETCIHTCPKQALRMKDGEVSIDRSLCDFCNKCVEKCPARAMQRIDRQAEVKELVDLVTREEIFTRVSGGGVTISGGEPLYQPEFLKELLQGMKQAGVPTCIETSMFAKQEVLESIAPYVDQFLVDIKILDEETHKKYTGVSNQQILSNFRYLAGLGKPILVRIPLIPGITATEENLRAIRAFVDSVNPEIPIEVLNFNSFAGSKYRFLDQKYFNDELRAFPREELEQLRSCVEE
ncbi:glycyl-radical enzyme activating protein [Anaerosacchariphilus sp. NSJ-68]|uniref:Glycyl-radical enzyme activating protein n=2 Tax=Lachnospiraceae TaxID=186803 RepID=A0A923LDI1_9FIRM|nr:MULTISPECIES: glycyl-radical enzyme activating protein [Lachnospiraceae]MBC5660544.1 glycyl-radical enzyme activating protein [Anaerosacchariphilus hominis]MBC5699407.1 glycyl-radical enzyme activating protein [Roseburia difficilis]